MIRIRDLTAQIFFVFTSFFFQSVQPSLYLRQTHRDYPDVHNREEQKKTHT